jgi:hypothetical protein
MAAFGIALFFAIVTHNAVVHQVKQMVPVDVCLQDIIGQGGKKRPRVCRCSRHGKDPLFDLNERDGKLVPVQTAWLWSIFI